MAISFDRKPASFMDDSGRRFAAQGAGHDKIAGEKLIQGRKQRLFDEQQALNYGPSTGPIKVVNPNRHLEPTLMDLAGMDGIMALQENAARADGKNFRVKGFPMAASQAVRRPSMAAIGGGGSGMGTGDGWEHPDVRGAKLAILQSAAGQHRQADIDDMRARDPQMVAFDREQADKTAIASAGRVDAGMAPIQANQRQRARDEGVADTRAAALEQEINPFFISERNRADKNLESRASMDAFARIMGSMRPETAEVFESKPELADTIRGSVMGGRPQAEREPVALEEPPMPDVATSSPGLPQISAVGEMNPATRVDIEQQLRERGYVVNDQTLMAAYNFLSGR